MNRKHLAGLVHVGGVVIICMAGVLAVPLLLTEMSWFTFGVILCAVAGGLACILTAGLMRRLL